MAATWGKTVRTSRFVSCQRMLFSQTRSRVSSRDVSGQDAKTEKKKRKKEERKEIIREIRKGYFADLHEFRRNGGKRFFALAGLLEVEDSIVFPQLKATSLSKREIHLHHQFPGHVTLVLMWLKAIGERMCDRYRIPFVERFSQEPFAQCYEINVIDGVLFKLFRSIIEKNLRKQKSLERQDNYLCFSGNTKPIKERLIENNIVGHAYLVDCNGLVRWKAHAFPTDEELKYMMECSQMLLRDAQRSTKSNDRSSTSLDR